MHTPYLRRKLKAMRMVSVFHSYFYFNNSDMYVDDPGFRWLLKHPQLKG